MTRSVEITKADCKHCGAVIYTTDKVWMWCDYAVAEGMNGGYCLAATDHHDHEPILGSMR